MNEDLPDGWTVATIAGVVDRLQYGYTAKAIESSSGIRLLRITDLRQDGIDWERVPGCSISEADYKKYELRDGDIVFARTGSIDKAWLVRNPPACVFASYLIRGRPSDFQLSKWLAAFIRSNEYVRQIHAIASGIGRANINAHNLAEIKLPLPPLDEQNRIVAKIESLTERSRAARAALEKVPQLLGQYRQSVLAAAFRGDLTADWRERHPDVEPASELLARIRKQRRQQWEAKHPKKKYVEPDGVDEEELPELPVGWCYARADEVVAEGTVITYGIVLPGDHVADGVPFVRGQDIEDGRILVNQLARTSTVIAARHERSSLRTGDVLLCIIRHLKVAIVPEGIDGANLTQGTVRLRPSRIVMGAYLAAYLAGPVAQAWMKKRYFGMAMPRINVEDARAIPIPIAPVAEQTVIANHLRRLEASIQQVEIAANEGLDRSSALDQAILAKAFRGELVPQDPADEPAAVLLERIRSGGSALPVKPRSVEKGRAKFYILLLLRSWRKPLSREMLDRSLILMLDDGIRHAILNRPTGRRMRTAVSIPALGGMDGLITEMLAAGQLVERPEPGFFAEGDLAASFDDAPAQDLAAVRETAEAMKVIHKDKHQAKEAEPASGPHAPAYELVP